MKEQRYERDDQRREAVPLVEGEGRLVVKKLAGGAYGVRKVIEFRKQKGRGPAQVETRWETMAAPPCGPELRRILEATAEADWPQDVRVALGEKVTEIRQLGEAQGDRGLVQAREAAYTLLGGATPEWVANQEMRHRKERDALREEARAAQRQVKELQQKWQEKRADFQRSDGVAAMNGRLLKEVEAGKEMVVQLKAAAKAAADQYRRDSEAAEKREERMGQMCNALKAAEGAKAAEQEAWATKEIEWAKEKANLLEAYEKCRQGLERAVRKLKEEKEKQVALEDKRKAARVKRKVKGHHPVVSDSGGESTRGPTPAGTGEATPEATRRPAAAGGPSRSGSPPREASKSGLRGRAASPRWREERWQREKGMEPRYGGERTWSGPGRAKDRRPPGRRWEDRRGSSPDPRERRRW